MFIKKQQQKKVLSERLRIFLEIVKGYRCSIDYLAKVYNVPHNKKNNESNMVI